MIPIILTGEYLVRKWVVLGKYRYVAMGQLFFVNSIYTFKFCDAKWMVRKEAHLSINFSFIFNLKVKLRVVYSQLRERESYDGGKLWHPPRIFWIITHSSKIFIVMYMYMTESSQDANGIISQNNLTMSWSTLLNNRHAIYL